ncbi:MAG: SRPBCC domain-containing protein [Planctomycetota bacterium]
MRLLILALVFVCCISRASRADDHRVVDEFEIEASVDDVWAAFTTTEGLKSWVAPLAEIDFRVGGKWRANYSEGGTLGDANTIENTILCFDPKRMLSIKATGFPENFPFKEVAKKTWSVFYFDSLGDSKTKITIVGLGYDDSEASQKMRAFFKPANKYSMDKLKSALEPASE